MEQGFGTVNLVPPNPRYRQPPVPKSASNCSEACSVFAKGHAWPIPAVELPPKKVALCALPPAENKIVATLSGIYNTNEGTWVGNWGMGKVTDEITVTSHFEYRRKNYAVDKPPNERTVVDISGSYNGYFMLQQQDQEALRVDENNVHLDFKPNAANPGLLTVIGFGANIYGDFDVRGLLNTENWQMQVEKFYREKHSRETGLSRGNSQGVIINPDLQEDLDHPGVVRNEKILREWRKLQDYTSAGPRDASKSQVHVLTPRDKRKSEAARRRAQSAKHRSPKAKGKKSRTPKSSSAAEPAMVPVGADAWEQVDTEIPDVPVDESDKDKVSHIAWQDASSAPSEDIQAELQIQHDQREEFVRKQQQEEERRKQKQKQKEEREAKEKEEKAEKAEKEREEKEKEENLFKDMTPEEAAAKKRKIDREMKRLGESLGIGTRYYSYSVERQSLKEASGTYESLAGYTARLPSQDGPNTGKK